MTTTRETLSNDLGFARGNVAIEGGTWAPYLLMSGPQSIESQNVSHEFATNTLTGLSYFDESLIETPSEPLVFRAETNQLDLFRLLLLAIGIAIGVYAFRK